jgi:hypothetical protein
MRVGFTIALNTKHHFVCDERIWLYPTIFDKFVFVCGACKNNGSTSWCREMPAKYHEKGRSIDGTEAWLESEFARDNNIIIAKNNGMWESKDQMINVALDILRHTIYFDENVFLWEIDADEHWTWDDIIAAENELLRLQAKTGSFLCNYFVGENLQAVGDWGEGKKLPYRRLWLWNGELFKTHEPPVLGVKNESIVLLPQRFNHFAYYFDEDVEFKEAWYPGHEGIYDRWKALQELPEEDFPRPISDLITGPWGKTNTQIVYIPT